MVLPRLLGALPQFRLALVKRDLEALEYGCGKEGAWIPLDGVKNLLDRAARSPGASWAALNRRGDLR